MTARRLDGPGADRVGRASLWAFLLGPVLGAGVAGVMGLAGCGSGAAIAAGVSVLGLGWGFIGSLALLGARAAEGVESALERRRARGRSEAGRLASVDLGALSEGTDHRRRRG